MWTGPDRAKQKQYLFGKNSFETQLEFDYICDREINYLNRQP